VGSVSLAIAAAPRDAACLRVTATGAHTVVRLFPLTPGQPAHLTVTGLPLGPVTIVEEVFAIACPLVQPGLSPTWLSEKPTMATLLPRQVVELTIVLRPAGQVRIRNDFQDGPPAAAMELSPARIDLGPTTVGTLSSAGAVLVRNAGAARAGALVATFAGPHADDFAVTGNTCGALDPGAVCVVNVAARPGAVGPRQATLRLAAAPGAAVEAALSVVGLAPARLSISPTTLNFGAVTGGTVSNFTDFRVRNEGGTPTEALVIELRATSEGSLAFRTGRDTCAGAVLAPGGTCVVAVRATPPEGESAGFEQTADLVISAANAAPVTARLQVTHR
jgi:hypothetical protein